VELESQGGYIQGSFSSTLPTRTASSSSGSSPQKFSTHWSSKNLDVGSLGLLAALTQLQGGLILNGDLSYSGESQQLNQAEGKVSLQLSKISLNEQSFMGFSLPKIQISDGVIQATLQKGRATLQEVRLGKMGGSDDLAAVVTGNIQMGPTFRQSNLNLTIAFSLSQNVLRSFGLLESLLSAGKQADGTYIYQLTGPVTSLVPAPVKNP
jgi:type II secretion system protein N